MQLSANGVRVEVDIRGPADGEPLLMIMGLGMQLIAWPDGLVDELVARGFRVIRFDNRDIGLSQSFDSAGVPNLALDSLRFALGLRVRSAYTLADMAAYKPVVSEGLCAAWKTTYRACTTRLPSGGLSVLQGLLLLEQTDISTRSAADPVGWAQLAQAEQPLPTFPRTGWGQP